MKEEFNKNNKSILEEINKYDTSNNKSDADIRLKKLSFELVSFSNSNEVLELYEKEIFNNKEKKELSTSEELILILYFYVKLAEKENINQGNINKKNNLLVIDIIELLSNKLIKEIEYNNNKNDATIIKHNSSSFLALCYSISSIPKLGFKLPMKLIETLILTLNHKESINDIINNVNDIPSICFSLTNILSDINDANELNNESISKDIELIVIRCIYFYLNAKEKSQFKEFNFFNYSFVSISLSRLNQESLFNNNIDLIYKITKDLYDNKEILSDQTDSIEEFLKILFGFSRINLSTKLNYLIKSEDVDARYLSITKFLNVFAETFIKENIGLFTSNEILELYHHYTNLFKDDVETIVIINQFIIRKEPIFLSHQTSKEESAFLDISSLVNTMLACSKEFLYVSSNSDKYNNSEKESFIELAETLSGIYHKYHTLEKNKQKAISLNTKNMYLEEVCSLLLSFSILKLEDNYLLRDLIDYIRKHISEEENRNKISASISIQLLSSAKYIYNKIAEERDYYYLIHDIAYKKLDSFTSYELSIVKRIILSDKVINESPFLNI